MKKLLSLVALGAVLAVPISAFAQSYDFTYSFKYKVEGVERTFVAGNIKATFNSTEDTTNGNPAQSTFVATLWRGSNLVGQVTSIPRNGTYVAKWLNTVAGDYHITLDKTDDLTVVSGSGTISNFTPLAVAPNSPESEEKGAPFTLIEN